MKGTATSERMIELAPGVTLEWLADGQIVAITSENSSREAVDAWADRLTELIKTWPTNRPMLVLADVSGGKNAQTPYLRSRASALMKVRPDVTLVTAMVVRHSILAQLIQIGLRAGRGGKARVQMFFSRQSAINWLMEKSAHHK
ncbi:MAG: hypothetical protein IT324_00290 [Anaerolineae bacterium]|nr:hypothetical protein [Anaerolineae bacterium]